MLKGIPQKTKITCLLGFLSVFIFTSCLFSLYRYSENKALERYKTQVQIQLAKRIQELITSRANFIISFANYFSLNYIQNESDFKKFAQDQIQKTPEFFAINWVNPKGTISWVYPEEPNKDAKNKNLLERPDIAPYLISAKENRSINLSHIVQLYQGPKGFAFYYPIYSKNFGGWVNGVFAYEKLLNDFIIQNDFQDFNIFIEVDGSDFSTFAYGSSFDKNSLTPYVADILNQTIKIYVQSKKNFLDYSQNLASILIYMSTLLISVMLAYLFCRLSENKRLLERVNTKLKLSNSVVGVLTHDFSNQVLVLENNIKKLRVSPNDPNIIQKLEKILKNQFDIIRRVNEIRKNDFEQNDFRFVNTNIVEQIKECIEFYESKIHDKKLLVNFRYDSTDLYIKTDPIYFQNNIIGNVLSNAIKFSHESGKIEIYAFKSINKIIIEIRDYGVGINKDHLKDIQNFEKIGSTRGTFGEEGSGFGLLQIKTFTEVFGGSFEIISHTKEVQDGTLVILTLPSA